MHRTTINTLYHIILFAGYYIVNYNEENWKYLESSISELPVNTVAQLIADSMDLARANLLDYNIPLSLLSRAIRTDTYIMKLPFVIAFDRLDYIDDMLYTTPIYPKFQVSKLESSLQVYLMISFRAI